MKTANYNDSDATKRNRTPRPIPDERIGRLPDRLKIAFGGRSTRAIADASGVSEGTLRNLLKGGIPQLDNILRIADATGVSAAWLATGEGSEEGLDGGAEGAAVPVDLAELALAIETVEEGLNEIRRTMRPAKKAELVVAVYDLFVNGEEEQKKNVVLRLVKSAA